MKRILVILASIALLAQISLAADSITKYPDLFDVHYANGTWVAVGQTVLTSTNTILWTTNLGSGVSAAMTDSAFADGSWIVVGWKGAILISSNGSSWLRQDPGFTGAIRRVCHEQGVWVAVGDGILTSSDGGTWTRRAVEGPTARLFDVHYGNGTWVAVGSTMDCDGTAILTSTDGSTWTTGPSRASGQLTRVHYADGKWVAVGTTGIMMVSSTANNWSAQNWDRGLNDVHSANGKWVAVGMGVLLNSADGTTWSRQDLEARPWLERVQYADGIWVTVGGTPKPTKPRKAIVKTSEDGVSWTQRDSGDAENLMDICHAQGTWVATGANGTILTSTNGITWTKQESGLTKREMIIPMAPRIRSVQ